MGYWIHVDELPTGGGGGSNGPNWGGCLGCLGFLFVVFVLWSVNRTYGLVNIFVSIVSKGLILGSIASVVGIFYILHEVEYERAVIIAGVVGSVGAAGFALYASMGLLGAIILAPIGAVAVMYLFCRYF